MYDPKGNAKDKTGATVVFNEALPPEHLRGIVHRFLELRTVTPLPQDYRFHALPDACSYLVLNQINRKIVGITKLRASSEELNLGRQFHFINIRFLPGVWLGQHAQIAYGLVKDVYTGHLPLITLNQDLSGLSFTSAQNLLCRFVETLIENQFVQANSVTEKIFQNIDQIHSVADMATTCEISSRQLQRVLKSTTGFSPHDFLKVLRLQQSLKGTPSLSYVDQSHFIHSFRKATGYTPGQYSKKFDV